MRQQFSATGRQLVILHQNHLAFTAFQCEIEAIGGGRERRAARLGIGIEWGFAAEGREAAKLDAEAVGAWFFGSTGRDLAFVGRSAPKAA